MRTFVEIIKAAGGPVKLHRQLGLEPRQIHAVHSWAQRKSIPRQHWRRLCELKLTTAEELLFAAEERDPPRGVEQTNGQVTA